MDGHAYSVLQCKNDVAGTPIDLVQVRNPWGSGEFESGEFGSGFVKLRKDAQERCFILLKPSPEELAAEADAAQAKFLAPREVGAGGGALTKSERALPV